MIFRSSSNRCRLDLKASLQRPNMEKPCLHTSDHILTELSSNCLENGAWNVISEAELILISTDQFSILMILFKLSFCFLKYRLDIWTRGVISDAEAYIDIACLTLDIFYITWPTFCFFVFDKHTWNLDHGCNFWGQIFRYQLSYCWYYLYEFDLSCILTYRHAFSTKGVISDAEFILI
jgi:hypothetical protein